MEKISLYEIADGINRVEEYVEDPQALTDYLDSLNIQFKDKAENIIRYMRTLELTSDAISNEIDRLTSLRKHYTSKSYNLKEYLAYSMNKTEKNTLETEVAKLSFRRSETTEVDDVSLIPEEYIVTKTTKSPDKTAIKSAIKGGIEVPGAHIETHKSLQIK